jgi:hypothetical protein
MALTRRNPATVLEVRRVMEVVCLFRDAVFFVLRTKNAVDGVWSAVAGFVVVADLHFS